MFVTRRGQRLCGLFVGVVALMLLAGCATVTDTTHTFRTVVIDAGHGGHDSGARSRAGIPEKTLALDTALRLDAKLRAAGFHTVLTRHTDVFIPLNTRVAMGNREANSIFISIHYNDSPRRKIHGAESYYRSPQSALLAARLARNVAAASGTPNRGAHVANFRVVRRAMYPSVLVEGGYLSNRDEAQHVTDPAVRERIAEAIAQTLIEQRR